MPSINEFERFFLEQVVRDKRRTPCSSWLGDLPTLDVTTKICDELFIMLVCGYISLILPILTTGGSFLFKKDFKHIWPSNLPWLGCITAGSIFFTLYFGGKNGLDTKSIIDVVKIIIIL